MPPARPIAERLEEKVDRERSSIFWNGTRCHEWTGSRLKGGGYGQIHYRGKTAYAHRLAWELNFGPANGLYVLHRCDNRLCVNPEHLFLGTFDDNMADMVAKKRQAWGERSGHAKLSDQDVIAIRTSTAKQADLAAKYRVNQSHISGIRSGKNRPFVKI